MSVQSRRRGVRTKRTVLTLTGRTSAPVCRATLVLTASTTSTNARPSPVSTAENVTTRWTTSDATAPTQVSLHVYVTVCDVATASVLLSSCGQHTC